MKKNKTARALLLSLTLITFILTTSAFNKGFGLDSYEIYLNNKLLLKQYLNQPLNLRVLQLDKVKDNGQLQIAYTHCMNKGVGKSRSLTLKDEAGHVLRKWTFTDATGQDLKMSIPVKELVQLEKQHASHTLSLYYLSHWLEKEEMLSTIRFK